MADREIFILKLPLALVRFAFQETDNMLHISDCVDLRWVALFGPSLYVHYYSYCIIEWDLWPKSFKRPANSLLYIYMALASVLLTNVAVRLVWLPLLDLQAIINKELSTWLATISMCLGFGKKSKLYRWAEWLSTPPGLSLGAQVLSILLFFWMLDATKKFGMAWNYIERMCSPLATAVCSEFNQKQRGNTRRGCRRRPNIFEYVDDDFQSPNVRDPGEAPVVPPSQQNSNIPWDVDTD